MSAGDVLSEPQFSPHGKGFYQRPLPGLEHFGDRKLPVEHIFKHPEIDRHPAEYSLTMNYLPTTKKVRTDALRPTQKSLDEPYLAKENRGGYDRPGAIKDGSGRYRLVDGHHKVARALLRGDKYIETEVWHA